jgi:hypothetical protein
MDETKLSLDLGLNMAVEDNVENRTISALSEASSLLR